MFHKHDWVECERFYAEPPSLGITIKGMSEATVQQLLFGVTTIHYLCRGCPEHKWEEVLGKSVNE